jgi:CheY-like chemotaxis protein
MILLVLDNPGDIFLFERALKSIEPSQKWRRVSDGLDAENYLLGRGPYADRSRNPLPEVIICDVHLARVSGVQLAEWLKGEPSLAHIKLCLFSTGPGDEEGLEQVTDCVHLKPESAAEWAPVLSKMIAGETVDR